MDLRGARDQALRRRSPLVTVRVAHSPTRRLDDECACGVVPRMRRKVHRAVVNALGHKSVIQTHGAGHARAQAGLPQVVEKRGGQMRRAADVAAPLIESEGPFPTAEAGGGSTARAQRHAFSGHHAPAQQRKVRDCNDGLGLVQQRDQDAAAGVAGGVVSGAVNRVDDPHGLLQAAAGFLAVDGDAGQLGQCLAQVLLNLQVDLRGKVALTLKSGGRGA